MKRILKSEHLRYTPIHSMYKIEKDKPFYTTLKYLKYLGQIPESTNKYYKWKFFTIFLISKLFCFFFITVCTTLHLVLSIMNESDPDISENISISLGGTGAGLVTLLFTVKYQEWSKFFTDLTDPSKFGKPATLQKTTNYLNSLGKLSIICAVWVIIIYGVAAWFNSRNCNQTDASFSQICPVFTPIWLPFGTNDVAMGTIVFVLQTVFIGILAAQPFFTICYIVYESTEILISHIDSLKHHLTVAFDVGSMEEKKEKLGFCVKYHQHVLEFGCRLNLLIKYTAGHMTLIAALVCGCITNQMLNTKPMGSLVYLVSWSFALFAFCHAGQRIKDETMSIADALLDSKWYNTKAATQRDVQFILLRCQTPISFEALPLGVIDYPFFYLMIKTGYSYFTILNQST